MKKRLFVVRLSALGLAFMLSCFSHTAFASEITKSLKATVDSVITIVKDENLKNNTTVRREKLREVIGKRFDYKQMAMRSLDKEWKGRTPAEKKEFVDLFKRLLENSYAEKIESFSDEKINYISEKVVKGKYALIKTEIARKDGIIEVDYKLINMNGDWLVYDFVVEKVSMVRNYRSQFNKIIRKESYEALVKKLSEKGNSIEAHYKNSVGEKL